jgi:soluble cytochrome b562
MNDAFGAPNKTAPRSFDEKAYRRGAIAEWDRRWHRLSTNARHFLLNHMTLPTGSLQSGAGRRDVSTSIFPPGSVEELIAGGFVEVQPGSPTGPRDRVVASESLHDFSVRTHMLRRHHLLADHLRSELAEYVHSVYFIDRFSDVLIGVLRAAGIPGPFRFSDFLNRHVLDGQWPALVARSLNDPLADRILEVVQKAKGKMPIAELPERIAGSDPNKVRSVMDKLVARLALVEDIRPGRWEFLVGLLPVVFEKITIANLPRERPPLAECARPRDVGPEGSPVVNDMRAVLLEVASQPPRLRQDQTLYSKEMERFQTVLEPLAGWMLDVMKWSNEGRLGRAITWARVLQLATIEQKGNQIQLHLTPAGHGWLSAGALEDHLEIYNLFRSFEVRTELCSAELGLFTHGQNPFDMVGPSDVTFLGTHVTAVELQTGKPMHYWTPSQGDHVALRKRLDTGLSVLKPGVFYRLDSVESHLVFAEHNPINQGLPAERVAVFLKSMPVPASRLRREDVGRQVIKTFVLERLLPFGCVRAAIDDEGQICIARGPGFDALFGREVARTKVSAHAGVTSKVVVQPDFSVVIIGPNPAPAAALAPLCERTTRGGGQGAIVLKLTRESVVKAVKNGLESKEVIARLKQHASNELPANVLRQVQEWSTWVRRVTASSLIALRCPDSDTADRVMAALKRRAERVNSTVVVIDHNKLTTTERHKLEDHGILVVDEASGSKTRGK